jgi:sensor domain CHASE-containing protein
MSLRNKTLIVIGLVIGALFIVVYITVSNILLRGFDEVEQQTVGRNVSRVVEAVDNEYAALNSKVGDWAPWDDTYTFVQDRNQAYIDDNLYDSVFANLEINMMLFYNTSEELVYQEGFDLIEGSKVPPPESVQGHLTGNTFLLRHEDTNSNLSGFVLLPENPLMVASQPIVTSDGQGPIQGTMMMTRFLDEAKIQELEDQTRLSITITRLDSENPSAEVDEAMSNLLSSMEQPEEENNLAVFIKPLNNEQIAGYTFLETIYGEPGLLVRVDMARDVFAQGQNSLRALIFSILAVGFVFVILTLVILERLVLARLAHLSADVEQIGVSGDISKRVTLPGQDELSSLAGAINQMLQDLQDSLRREKELRREVKRLRIEIDKVKQQEQVEEIVESDFFRDLQVKARAMRRRREEAEGDAPEGE